MEALKRIKANTDREAAAERARRAELQHQLLRAQRQGRVRRRVDVRRGNRRSPSATRRGRGSRAGAAASRLALNRAAVRRPGQGLCSGVKSQAPSSKSQPLPTPEVPKGSKTLDCEFGWILDRWDLALGFGSWEWLGFGSWSLGFVREVPHRAIDTRDGDQLRLALRARLGADLDHIVAVAQRTAPGSGSSSAASCRRRRGSPFRAGSQSACRCDRAAAPDVRRAAGTPATRGGPARCGGTGRPRAACRRRPRRTRRDRPAVFRAGRRSGVRSQSYRSR